MLNPSDVNLPMDSDPSLSVLNATQKLSDTPIDALTVFRSTQQYLLKVLEDLIQCSRVDLRDAFRKRHEEELKYTRILLYHSDRVVEAKYFLELLQYVHLFRQCIVTHSLPSKHNIASREYYLRNLDKLVYNSDMGEFTTILKENELSDKQYSHSTLSGLGIGSLSLPIQDISVLLCTADIETNERKKWLLKILRIIRKVSPTWATHDNTYCYHCCQILRILDIGSTMLQNYRVILEELNENFSIWRMSDLISAELDMDYLRKASEASFQVSSPIQLKQYLFQDLLRCVEGCIQAEERCKEGTAKEDPLVQQNVLTRHITEETSYNKPINETKVAIRKPSRGRQSDKFSMTEAFSKEAAQLPRVTGVFFGKSCLSWVAQIPVRKGHTKQLYFSVKKHGFLAARAKAIEARVQHIANSNSIEEDGIQYQPLIKDATHQTENITKHFTRSSRSQSYASRARASPCVPGVSYDSKRACWTVQEPSDTLSQKQFHVRKLGGFSAARLVAIQYLNETKQSQNTIDSRAVDLKGTNRNLFEFANSSPDKISVDNSSNLQEAIPNSDDLQEDKTFYSHFNFGNKNVNSSSDNFTFGASFIEDINAPAMLTHNRKDLRESCGQTRMSWNEKSNSDHLMFPITSLEALPQATVISQGCGLQQTQNNQKNGSHRSTFLTQSALNCEFDVASTADQATTVTTFGILDGSTSRLLSKANSGEARNFSRTLKMIDIETKHLRRKNTSSCHAHLAATETAAKMDNVQRNGIKWRGKHQDMTNDFCFQHSIKADASEKFKNLPHMIRLPITNVSNSHLDCRDFHKWLVFAKHALIPGMSRGKSGGVLPIDLLLKKRNYSGQLKRNLYYPRILNLAKDRLTLSRMRWTNLQKCYSSATCDGRSSKRKRYRMQSGARPTETGIFTWSEEDCDL
ncbi:AP2 domain transcription factor AP2VIIa-4 [Cardiosporidium cionae]|uniref:AP2 domain transcription factor AP2VIIa-4 n=1 Tax=Cardiosporidium cionae TaxID=476202 RepID=A0ABQ7J5S8_9APIC|nr:AP2 domain transcription factor AP2VIIa-4 [Cardiosporidium cionae]|eukprot:KAF8819040.1 AP2 domain transcription factor AP2VIIa-4 [Cardiosporidium cionae]